MPDHDDRSHKIQIAAILTSLAGIIAGGTVFFHYVEQWSWIDSYFFSVITLSTVGYGDMVPVTTLGKIGTTVFIFAGLGVFAYAIQLFGTMAVNRQRKKIEHRKSLTKLIEGEQDLHHHD